LKQPDFGTVVILFITTLAVLFIVGSNIFQILLIFSIGILIILLLISIEPYRIQRIFSFQNPWKDPFGKGYQLTQSLIAFGRGKFLGQGLGNSVQKLEYLPEAHTDFIFAILGEELGYFGTILVLLMIFTVSFRAIFIGQNILEKRQIFFWFFSLFYWNLV